MGLRYGGASPYRARDKDRLVAMVQIDPKSQPVGLETIHRAAVQSGATVLGEGPRHYIFDADQLRAFIQAVQTPPCPVPLRETK